MVCPYEFSRLHRRGWVLCVVLYLMALACALTYETEAERLTMIILCMKVYLGMLFVVEMLAAWCRKCWMDGVFKSFTVDVRMASQKEEDARDVMYNIGVWPVVKAHNQIREWYADSLGVVFKIATIGPVIAAIAVLFA